MRKSLDHYLTTLASAHAVAPEVDARVDAYVRRVMMARYGSLSLPRRHAEAASAHDWRWMLRPAMGVAGVSALAVGAIAATMYTRHDAAPTTPAAPVTVASVAPAPVTPGSGIAVSVFSASVAGSRQPAAGGSSQRMQRASPRRGAPLTPAEGVFTKWGTGVFSDELSSAPKASDAFSG